MIKIKTQLPFGMAPAFFWTVFAGLISGLLGVGGGFVIVPSLRKVSNFTMPTVVATSLMVVRIVSIVSYHFAAPLMGHCNPFCAEYDCCFIDWKPIQPQSTHKNKSAWLCIIGHTSGIDVDYQALSLLIHIKIKINVFL